MTIYLQNSSWSIFLIGQSILLFSPKNVHEHVLPRMGWSGRCHVNSTIWSSSHLILVSGEPVVPMSRQFTHAFQLLALGFMVGCTFAPNLNTFTGENIRG